MARIAACAVSPQVARRLSRSTTAGGKGPCRRPARARTAAGGQPVGKTQQQGAPISPNGHEPVDPGHGQAAASRRRRPAPSEGCAARPCLPPPAVTATRGRRISLWLPGPMAVTDLAPPARPTSAAPDAEKTGRPVRHLRFIRERSPSPTPRMAVGPHRLRPQRRLVVPPVSTNQANSQSPDARPWDNPPGRLHLMISSTRRPPRLRRWSARISPRRGGAGPASSCWRRHPRPVVETARWTCSQNGYPLPTACLRDAGRESRGTCPVKGGGRRLPHARRHLDKAAGTRAGAACTSSSTSRPGRGPSQGARNDLERPCEAERTASAYPSRAAAPPPCCGIAGFETT